MNISRLILKNVKCYKNLDISFLKEYEDEEPIIRDRTIILGNNGTGKSTILKSIALLLCGSSALGELIGNLDKWIRHGASSCTIEAHLLTAQRSTRVVKLEIHKGDNLTKLISRNEESLNTLDESLEYTERNYLNIGYGVHRRIGSAGSFEKSNSFSNTRANNVSTLFSSEAALYPLESWIMDLDYRHGAKGLTVVKKALNQLLPDASFHSIDKDNKSIKFKNVDGVVDFDQLSDGFQITANWLGDLLYRITQTYNDYKNPLKAKFILLIDEIALHLHPKWQRTIIQSIKDLFPNAQIIATTHSPFVAQQAGYCELYTLIRKENKELDIFHYENDPRKLLIHQILMSDIFGLETDESVYVENMKNEVRDSKTGVLKAQAMTFGKSKTTESTLKNVSSLKDIPLSAYKERSPKGEEIAVSSLTEILKKLRDEET